MTSLPHAVIADVVIVQCDFTIWTGARKMTASDYVGLARSALPPEEAASLGRMRLVAPEALHPLVRIRADAERDCAALGIRFLNGWAVPTRDVADLSRSLTRHCGRFEQAVTEFIARYEQVVDDWIREIAQKNAGFADQLARARLPADEVRRRFGQRLRIFRIAGASEDAADTLGDAAQDLRATLLRVVLDELSGLATRAREVPDGVFKCSVRPRLARVAARLRRFAFCDPAGHFLTFAGALERAAQGEGTIREAEYTHLRDLLRPIRDVATLEQAMAAPLPLHRQPGLLDAVVPPAQPAGGATRAEPPAPEPGPGPQDGTLNGSLTPADPAPIPGPDSPVEPGCDPGPAVPQQSPWQPLPQPVRAPAPPRRFETLLDW